MFVTKKKNIGVIYKPTLIVSDTGTTDGILGNAYDEGSAPAVVKIDSDELGFYAAVRMSGNIHEVKYRPKDTLAASIVEGTTVLCAIPTIAPIPFGTSIKSLTFDEAFIAKMKDISPAHSFWVDSMVEVMEQ